MTTCLLTKPTIKQPIRLTSQLETIQEDIARLSGFVLQLSDFSDEQLEAFGIADQLDAIHRCLNRFETHCMARQIASAESEFAEPLIDETCESFIFPKPDWNGVRKDAKRANKLTNQLTSTLSKIRSGTGGVQPRASTPEDIDQIYQTVSNAITGLVAEWTDSLG